MQHQPFLNDSFCSGVHKEKQSLDNIYIYIIKSAYTVILVDFLSILYRLPWKPSRHHSKMVTHPTCNRANSDLDTLSQTLRANDSVSPPSQHCRMIRHSGPHSNLWPRFPSRRRGNQPSEKDPKEINSIQVCREVGTAGMIPRIAIRDLVKEEKYVHTLMKSYSHKANCQSKDHQGPPELELCKKNTMVLKRIQLDGFMVCWHTCKHVSSIRFLCISNYYCF